MKIRMSYKRKFRSPKSAIVVGFIVNGILFYFVHTKK